MGHERHSSRPGLHLGCPRSGTTLLRNLLSSHPHLAFRGESHFIPSFLGRHGDPPDERAARKLATEILNLRWVRDWGLELVPGDFAAERSFSAIVARLYAEVVRVEGKRRWGTKHPSTCSKSRCSFASFLTHACCTSSVTDGT